jgi:hypothetical protein
MSNLEDTKTSLEDWAVQYEKAQADGVFGKPEEFIPTPHTSEDSFFGVSDNKTKETINEPDAEYWRQVYALSSADRDPADIINEMLKPQTKKELGEKVDRIAADPNPIQSWTVGMDQDSSNPPEWGEGLNAEVDELAELKVELQSLVEKVMTAEVKGKNDKGAMSKIKELRKKIDALSDEVSVTFTGGPNGGK